MTPTRLLALLGLVVPLSVLGGVAEARVWQVLPNESRIVFQATQGNQTFEGTFESFAVEIDFDPDSLEKAHVVVTIDVGSLKTPDRSRTEQALSAMWLGALDHPQARYEAQSFRRLEGDRYEVDAVLTLKGVSRELRHEAEISIDGDKAHAQGTVPLTRTEFEVGAGTGPDTIGLEVIVRFEIAAKAE